MKSRAPDLTLLLTRKTCPLALELIGL